MYSVCVFFYANKDYYYYYYYYMYNTGYKSCVNRYIKQNSIYITSIILDISHVSIDILSRIASTLQV